MVILPADYIDEDVFEELPFHDLYEQHSAALFRYVARRLGAEVAEDVLSQVFVEAMSNAANFDPSRGSERVWMFGIATNLIRRHRRAETLAHKAYAREADRPPSGTTHLMVDDRLLAEQGWARVSKVLAGLNADDRDLLLLFAWADLPYEVIADIVGLPVGTVKSRIHRTRAKLRSRLGMEDPKENLL